MTTLPLCNDVLDQPNAKTDLEIRLLNLLTNRTLLQPDDYLDLRLNPLKLQTTNGKDMAYLRVTGNAMSNDNIRDGNLIIVDRSITPRPDDIIACYVDDVLTIRRWHRKGPGNVLIPSNPLYQSQYIRLNQRFEVCGVVIWSIQPQHCFRINY